MHQGGGGAQKGDIVCVDRNLQLNKIRLIRRLFYLLGGKLVNPLSIDPNERVTPSHHSGGNGMIDQMIDPSSGEMSQGGIQDGMNGDIGVDGAELMASLAVTEIGVIPPPPMFSCSPSPPPPPPPPSVAIDHRSSQLPAHSTSSVVQPGHIITVSSHVLHQHQSSNLAPVMQQQPVHQANTVFHNHPISSVQMSNNNSSVVTVMSNSNHSHSYHPHGHHDPRHLNAYEYQHHPGNPFRNFQNTSLLYKCWEGGSSVNHLLHRSRDS
jgi:hypothetical protein